MTIIPGSLRYTEQHEWVAVTPDGLVRIGITDYAQEALGGVVYVMAPAVGMAVQRGATMGEVESTKSVSDIYAPVSGVVHRANGELESRPELVNSDPYGEGWMVEIRPPDGADLPGILGGLLDAESYSRLVNSAQ